MSDRDEVFRALFRAKVDRIVRDVLKKIDAEALYIVTRDLLEYLFPEHLALYGVEVTASGAVIYVTPLDFERASSTYGSVAEVRPVYSGRVGLWMDEELVTAEDPLKLFETKARGARVATDSRDLATRLVDRARSVSLVRDELVRLRRSKMPEELRLIQEAVKRSSRALEMLLQDIRSGITEAELAARLEHLMRIEGCEDHAFNTIVAFPPNSSFPHHTATSKRYDGRSPILVDFGCRYHGYVSDITRMLVPSIDTLPQDIERAIEAVSRAIDASIEVLAPGAKASEVDGRARSVLREAGLAKYFVHSLGHGIGVAVHEQPRLSPFSSVTLIDSDVVTIEPGVYVPRTYGVRIEEDVAVRRGGADVLTRGIERVIEFKR